MSNTANDEATKDKHSEIKDSTFDITGLLLDYLSNWKWFILSVLICGAAAYYYASTIIPTYEVTASIYLNDEKSANTRNLLPGAQSYEMDNLSYMDETEIEVLKSRNNLKRIVDSLDLAYSYFQVGRLRDIAVYHSSAVIAELDSIDLARLRVPITITIEPTKEGYSITGESVFGDNDEKVSIDAKTLPAKLNMSQGVVTLKQSPFIKKARGTERIVINNPNVIAADLAQNLSIAAVQNATSILHLDLKTMSIEQGCDVLKVLVKFYNRQIIEDKNRSALQTEAFILDRLVMISGELKDVEDRLLKYRQDNNITDLDAQTSMSLTKRDASQEELANTDAQIAILGDVERTVKRQDSYTMLPVYSNDQAVSQSIEAYNRDVANYERSLKTMGENHPLVERLRDELVKQKSQIVSNIDAARKTFSARRSTVARIEGRSSGQLAVQPSIDKGLNEIFREQQVKVNIYTFLLQKREEIALQKTLATPTAQFIDNATGFGPVAPNRKFYLTVGLLIGLLIPAVLIFLRRLIFPKFNDKDELARLTNVPIIGEICRNEDPDCEIVVGENVSTSIAELFRLLRNNINFLGTPTQKSKVILVTSSVSGEGKTFIAMNLATTLALTGKRTIVVGLDIRRPVLAHIAGLTNQRGATTFLSGQETDLDSLICESTVNPNLYVLPAGPVPPNPNELLLGDNMTRMINELRRNFDYIVIDSAPIGMVSDTYLIIPHSDVQIYVTRAGVSTARGLKVLHDAIRKGQMPHPYIVLNSVNVSSSAYIYRNYGRYGYNNSRHSYGYGYGDSAHHHTKRHWWQRKARSNRR